MSDLLNRIETLVGEISSTAKDSVANQANALGADFELASTSRAEARDEASKAEAMISEVIMVASENQKEALESLLNEARENSSQASTKAREAFNKGLAYFQSLPGKFQEIFGEAAPSLEKAIQEHLDRKVQASKPATQDKAVVKATTKLGDAVSHFTKDAQRLVKAQREVQNSREAKMAKAITAKRSKVEEVFDLSA